MSDDDFKRGERKAKLDNIEREVGEIKIEMKEHNRSDKEEFGRINSKIDTVHEAAKSAAATAYHTAENLRDQEKINSDRHKEISESFVQVNKAIAKLTKDQSDIKLRMYLFAAFIGGGSGSLVPIVKDWLL